MLRKLVILGIVAGSSASVPVLYQANPDAFDRLVKLAVSTRSSSDDTDSGGAYVTPSIALAATEPQPGQQSGRKVVVAANSGGHFSASFKFNGRPVDAMIDTGATLVALNASTARRIGVSMQPSDFKHQVNTANGVAKAAVVDISRLQIGNIMLEDVQAMVLEDKALQTTLIGMSFLKRLGKYQVENGNMLLVQ